MSTQQTGVIPFTADDLQSAGAVFTTSSNMLEKYSAKQSALLKLAAEAGEKLPKELDDELMNWQVSAKKAVKFMNETRSVYTDKAHAFIKVFTAIENTLSKDLYEPIQRVRDTSARIHAEEAAEAARKEAEALAEKQRRIDAIAQMEAQLRTGYAAHLSNMKETMLMVYSNATLDQLEEAEEVLKRFVGGTMTEADWNNIPLNGDPELAAEVRTVERFRASSEHFTKEVTAYAEYLLNLLPQRREELERGQQESKAAADLAKKQKEEAEAAQLAAEKRAHEEAEKAKQAATVTVMVAQANRQEEAPRMVESYSIDVHSVDGWRAIVDYYLTNSGASAVDLGKIKLDQMKAFAERQAKSTGEIVSHADVSYHPKYKAVARSTRKKSV